jgi:hypothetical protein
MARAPFDLDADLICRTACHLYWPDKLTALDAVTFQAKEAGGRMAVLHKFVQKVL